MTWTNQGAAANSRPAGQSAGSANFSATLTADRAFPAAVTELGRSARRCEAMLIAGAIYPVEDTAGFTREAWCQLVSVRPEFHRYPARELRNPFTGAMTIVQSSQDAADVVLEGRVVGKVYWSMSEEQLVNVSVEPLAISLVREWAASLGGEFRADSTPSDAEPGVQH